MIVEQGVVVTVDFELRDAQGDIIQEHGGDPIVYLHGSEHEVFPKLQEALEGKSIGDEVFVQLEPEDAFGEYDPDLIRIEDLEQFSEELSIGMQLEEVPSLDDEAPDEVANPENTGFGCVWTVSDIAQGKAVLDGNHPFSGIALRYKLKILDLRLGNEEEKAQGAAAQSLFSIAGNENFTRMH